MTGGWLSGWAEGRHGEWFGEPPGEWATGWVGGGLAEDSEDWVAQRAVDCSGEEPEEWEGIDSADWLRAGNHLVLDVCGLSHDLPPSHDLGEGARETAVTLADDRGMAVYSDTDGDGWVDHVSRVGFDGSWSSWRRSPDPEALKPPELQAAPENLDSGWVPATSTPPATPVVSTDNWRLDGWECVERGQWG